MEESSLKVARKAANARKVGSTAHCSANIFCSSSIQGKSQLARSLTRLLLAAQYDAGMKDIGGLYSTRMASAAREAGLQVDQVKVANLFAKGTVGVCHNDYRCRIGSKKGISSKGMPRILLLRELLSIRRAMEP